MELLVISDSHGRSAKIEEAVKRQIKKPDAIIFLGDGLRDITDAEIGDIPVYAVKGNCDTLSMFSPNAPDEQCLVLGDKRIFFTHGNRYGVKSTLTPLLYEAAKREADIVLFGHTHEKCEGIVNEENDLGIKLKKPIYIMNPGSIGTYPYSFGAVHISARGELLFSHGTLA